MARAEREIARVPNSAHLSTPPSTGPTMTASLPEPSVSTGSGLARARAAILLLFLLGLAACDFAVTNPGPMQDDQLDDPAAREGLVTGMAQTLASAHWRVAFIGAEAAREYTQGGRIFTTKLAVRPGQLTREDISSEFWNHAVRARWVAEDGVRRFRETFESFGQSPWAGEALVYVGFANRLLGENFCEAVIDGGEVQPGHVYFERAERAFSEAIEIARATGREEVELAALGGRASVRVHLGDWDGAREDAARVPEDFAFYSRFHDGQLAHFNGIHYSNANQPFRTHSVVGTFAEEHYLATGDPRVRWGEDPSVPTAEDPSVPWLFQLKYDHRAANIRLSSGREARLIEAEAILRDGDEEGAVAILNALREGLRSDHDGGGLPLWPAPSSLPEAWRSLTLERGIELWLEGRRLSDLRRWIEDGSPGEIEDISDRIRLCLPIADSEITSNPHVSSGHPDPVSRVWAGG
jgi:starch-binding outer membrane protein, SusD/RagB family